MMFQHNVSTLPIRLRNMAKSMLSVLGLRTEAARRIGCSPARGDTRVAASALLLTFHGYEDVRLRRKVE